MAGSALGAPVDGDRHYLVQRRFPQGVTSYWPYDMGVAKQPKGTYTGDCEAMLCVARSLLRCGAVVAEDQVEELVRVFGSEEPAAASSSSSTDDSSPSSSGRSGMDPASRRLNPYMRRLIGALANCRDVPAAALPFLAQEFLRTCTPRRSNTASDRPEREPHGPADHSAAARVAPIGLVFRDAPTAALRSAVEEAVSFSHPHPAGLDGARVVAATVAWLSRQPKPAPGDRQLGTSEAATSEASALLLFLLSTPGLVQTEEMRRKLELIHSNLFQVGPIPKWPAFYKSAEWGRLTTLLPQLAHHGVATLGTEAVAVVLWVFCCNWRQPVNCLTIAAGCGGAASVTAQLAGAFAGALHGDSFMPHHMWEDLEKGTEGKEEAVALAKHLATLRLV